MLNGKTVVLGVTGGIAAYKAADLASRLTRAGACVITIMTENAAKFVTPLTFQNLTHQPVYTGMFEEPKVWDVEHISIANRADLILVAPATANIVGKIASGIADDMLSTVVMATKAPVLFVPAMNVNMYANPIYQRNECVLRDAGYHFMEPETGLMAEKGISGKGRFPQTDAIIEAARAVFSPVIRDMAGKTVLVTAGPTREAIDPVRYISNHSSGKMGYAVCRNLLSRGARVILVTGPVDIRTPEGAEVVNTESAHEMHSAVMARQNECDAFVLAAAVADYRPEKVSEQKIKKSGDQIQLTLVKNPDIAADLGRVKRNRCLVTFAAETELMMQHALEKMKRKHADICVANDVTQEGAGFGVDTNIVTLIHEDGMNRELPVMSKADVACEIVNEMVLWFGNRLPESDQKSL